MGGPRVRLRRAGARLGSGSLSAVSISIGAADRLPPVPLAPRLAEAKCGRHPNRERKMSLIRTGLAALALLWSVPLLAQESSHAYEGTYSIITRDPETGELGMAVQSRAFAVGYRTWSAKGGLAVFAHQASSSPYYGRIGLEMLAAGLSPEETLRRLVASDERSASRQVAIVDIHGRTAAFTGGSTSDWKGHQCGVDYCAQGNTLAGPEVVSEMARVFEETKGQPLEFRMLAALDAAQAAGGDRRGMQAAAMFIVQPLGGSDGYSDVTMDLRVNDHPLPLVELRRLLHVFQATQLIREANELFDAGSREQGLEKMLDLARFLPERANVWADLAGMHARMGQRTEALAALARALELNPGVRAQTLESANFESLRNDAEFRRLVGGP
jgi:uncharacterized Ntn-hydrolase superfamily protein